MDKKTETMISLGAAYGAGCIPCFDHYYSIAKEEKIMDDEIKVIIALAKKVRKGADIVIKKSIDGFLEDGTSDQKEEEMPNPCQCNC